MVMPRLRYIERVMPRVRVGPVEGDLEWRFGGPGRFGLKSVSGVVRVQSRQTEFLESRDPENVMYVHVQFKRSLPLWPFPISI